MPRQSIVVVKPRVHDQPSIIYPVVHTTCALAGKSWGVAQVVGPAAMYQKMLKMELRGGKRRILGRRTSPAWDRIGTGLGQAEEELFARLREESSQEEALGPAENLQRPNRPFPPPPHGWRRQQQQQSKQCVHMRPNFAKDAILNSILRPKFCSCDLQFGA